MKHSVMKSRSVRTTLLTSAALGVLAAAPAAQAQQAQTDQLEEIVVTGSRIARQDFVSNSPLTTVSAEAFQTTGSLTPENLLNQLPQVVPDITGTSNNPPGEGRANINLRGLGSNRNLVLVNGRRMIGGDESGAVDVNVLPTALVERVEVISGGASAVYGADAVAGVVNFILKDDFEGIQADFQYGISDEGDAEERAADVTLGSSLAEGRGNVTLTVGYSERERLGKGERPFSANADTATSFLPWGSVVFGANAPTQAAVDSVFSRYGGTYTPGGTTVIRTDRFGFNSDNTLFSVSHAASAPNVFNFRGSSTQVASAFFPGRLSYNFEPDNALLMPLERINVASTGKYEINDYVEAYVQAIYTNYNAASQLAPSPAPTGSQGFFFAPVTNPFLPADLRALAASRTTPNADIPFLHRFLNVGPRIEEYTNNVFQVLGGLRGDIPMLDGWKYDFYAATGRVDTTTTQFNNISYSRVQQLLTAADGGVALCGGFNPFGIDKVSSACAEFIEVTAKNQTTIEQDVLEASVSGNLFELPAGAVGLALGAQYRAETFDFKPDQVLSSGDVSGFNAQQPLAGEIENKDFFAELLVPLIADVPFAKYVGLTAGFRYSDHSAANTFSSYKVEGEWQIDDPVRLRGSYQRAVRAPNIGELFGPQNEDNPEVEDPCNAGPGRTAAILALCQAQFQAAGAPTSLLATYTQPNDQVDALTGGNPNLFEETADTFTVGTVLTSPFEDEFLKRLTLSVDYYNIKIKDAIGSISAEDSVPRCFNSTGQNPSLDPNNSYCQLLSRRAIDGALVDIVQTSQNLSTIKTSGIDVQLDWGFDLPNEMGALNINSVLSWLDSYKEQLIVGDPFQERAGTIGTNIGEALPEWKATISTTYSYDIASLTFRARFIDGMQHRQAKDGTNAAATGTKDTWYFDLSGRAEVTENISFRAGVNNLFDQQPRSYSPNVQATTDPSVYDVIGRRFFVGATLKF